MTVSDVLKKVLKNLCREDVLATNVFSENGTEPTDEQNELLSDLMECLRDTIESVVFVYHFLKTKEKVVASDGKILFENLSKTLIDVVSLKNESKISVPFSMFPEHVECPNGNFEICYTYLPAEVENLEDEIDVPKGKITPRILAAGCTSRFFLKRGLFQDANVWDVSFQRLLLVGGRPKHMPSLASRGWF